MSLGDDSNAKIAGDDLLTPVFILFALVVNELVFLFYFGSQFGVSFSNQSIFIAAVLNFIICGILILVFIDSLKSKLLTPMLRAQSILFASLLELGRGAADALPDKIEAIALLTSKELESACQRERLIADFSSDLIFSLNADGKILDFNPQMADSFGYPPASLLAKSFLELFPNEDSERLAVYLKNCRAGAKNAPFECRALNLRQNLFDLEIECEWSNTANCFYCLARDITLSKQNQRMKAEFSAMVTHDLRSPIAGLSFLLQNLRSGNYGTLTPDALEQISMSQLGIERILKLIGQLLEAEELEGGDIPVKLESFSTLELYENVQSMMQSFATGKSITLKFPISDSFVVGDFSFSSKILSNLLSNAIKWSPPESNVEISEERDASLLSIFVKDNGPGIPENRIQTIFERFKVLDQDSDRSGNGLGLYIARKMAELQYGSVAVSSVPGKGSKFCFSIPIEKSIEL